MGKGHVILNGSQYSVQQQSRSHTKPSSPSFATEFQLVQTRMTAILCKTNRHKGSQRMVIVCAVLDGRGQPLPLQFVIAGARSPAKQTNKKHLARLSCTEEACCNSKTHHLKSTVAIFPQTHDKRSKVKCEVGWALSCKQCRLDLIADQAGPMRWRRRTRGMRSLGSRGKPYTP